MLDRMTAEEYLRWKIFYKFEPFGCAVEDSRFGKLVAVTAGGSPLEHFPGYHPLEKQETLERVRSERLKLKMMNHPAFYNEESEEE